MTDHLDHRQEFGSPLDYMVDQQSRMTMATVRRAVARGDAVLAYQPVVQSDRLGRAAFHEGVIRIIDETGRVVPLHDFMHLAETTELGRQIDCLALDLGLKTLAEDASIRLSINMSARSIGYPTWMRMVRDGIGHDPSLAERLIFEISETSAMGMPEVVGPFMRELQSHGVSFALDDFGSGYTSFRYLRDFCFDMIKIDGQFIREIATQRDNQVLARALQSIAHHFDMFTVADSVESAEDAAFLIDMGIDCMQGFYFGGPTLMPPWRSPGSAAVRA
ncbi:MULTISPECIES: EAL domain-containing protein [Paracoccus]|uniref:EAL domain-containing protein n=1 Tax=Paracoccus litorisediminis TaxID=2006130 RepID=A0A844HLN9_9RHOB|nr:MULTISPECIES: EAL domain-containing protein [Paracoccus]MBD9526268.1 EAL domain-containing protein [Paracoccus sp. PAR01]MTH58671.1 EAL domain-containing protein [Paracoccus litorisediminis]